MTRAGASNAGASSVDKFAYSASGKQVLHHGQHFADTIGDEEAMRVAQALNALESASVVIQRSPSKRLADAEEILGELAGVFEGYARLHASKGTPEGDEKSKRNTRFSMLILDFLAQGYCSHEHQVPFQKDNGITSLLCLGCGQTRMEFYTGRNPELSKEHVEATSCC